MSPRHTLHHKTKGFAQENMMQLNNNSVYIFFSGILWVHWWHSSSDWNENTGMDIKLIVYECNALMYSLLQTVYFIFTPPAPQDCQRLPLWYTVGKLLTKRSTLQSCCRCCTANDGLSENLSCVPTTVTTESLLSGILPFACALMTSSMTACLSITPQVCDGRLQLFINTVFHFRFA